MKSMTLRGLEPELEKRLKQVAEERGQSANQTALEALRQHLGVTKGKRFTAVHSDLDHLFGRWDEETFAEVQEKIDRARLVDDELWK